MIHIRGAHQRHALPGQDEDRTTVGRVQEGDGARQRELGLRQEYVTAAQDAQPGATSHLAAQCVGPGSCCADHHAGAYLDGCAGFSRQVPHQYPGHAVPGLDQSFHTGVIQGQLRHPWSPPE